MAGKGRGEYVKKVLTRTETVPAVLLALAFVAGAMQSRYFLDTRYLLDSSTIYVETGLLALGSTFVILSGNIDLSVASMTALVACVTAKFMASGWPPAIACVAGLVVGTGLGWINGILVAKVKLPSFVVTLATMAVYRGLAEVVTGVQSIRLPDSFVGLDTRHLVGHIPFPLAIFLIVAVVLGVILHRSLLGRWVYALGTNEEASYYSGLPTQQTKAIVFAISGLMAGLAALMMDSRLGVARYDDARGLELDAITAVVLGGASIFGGKGTMLGTVLALFLIAVIRIGMGVANVKPEYQLAVIGTLLVAAVLGSNLATRMSARR